MPDTPAPKHAGVIAPPPLIHLTGLGMALVLQYWVYPLTISERDWIWLPALAFFSAGGILDMLSMLRFRRAKTDVLPWKPTSALVDTGVYRFTRNPIYVGMMLVMAGLGFAFNTLWVFIFMPAVFLVIHFGVIRREERYLEKLFGEDYRAYMKKTPRWL